MKKYYHVTKNENVSSILANGLISSTGTNSKKIEDNRKGIFLCDTADIPYWSILLGLVGDCAVFEVTLPDEAKPEYLRYCCYGEYLYTEDISPENIVLANIPTSSQEAMTALCQQYLITFSRFSSDYMYYHMYAEQTEEDYLYIRGMLKAIIAVLPHLNYASCDKQKILDFYTEYSDEGETVFTDYLEGIDEMLFDSMLWFGGNEFYDDIKVLHDFIKNNLDFIINEYSLKNLEAVV